MIRRRGFIAGFAPLLAAPAIIRSPGLLMPIKPLVLPAELPFVFSGFETRIPLTQLPSRKTMAELIQQVAQCAGGEWPNFMIVDEADLIALQKDARALRA